MKHKDDLERRVIFTDALKGKRIPILTLDNKWYHLLTDEARATVSGIEKQLNTLLKRQGKLNTESKEIKRLKKKLVNEIMPLVDDAEKNPTGEAAKQIDRNKRLVDECNQKLEAYQDELLDLPKQIDELNSQLMLITMDCCYETMQENSEEIEAINEWVTDIRIELKKRLIHKQEMEQRNQAIYTYMHDVFGAEVIDLFDMQYAYKTDSNEQNK